MTTQPVVSTRRRNSRLLIFGLGVLLLAAIILRLVTPTSPDSIEKIPQPLLPAVNDAIPASLLIRSSFPTIEVPKTLPVYEISASAAFVDTLVRTYTLLPVIENTIWIDDTKNTSLTYDRYAKSYQLFFESASPSASTIPQQQAIQVAQNFVGQTLGETALLPQTGSLHFLLDESGAHYEEADAQSANTIAVPFSNAVQNYPLYVENSLTSPIEVFVTSSNTIKKVIFSDTLISLGTPLQAPTRSIQTAAQDSTNARIIRLNYEADGIITTRQLKEFDITQASIEYRAIPRSRLAVPYFRLIGTGKTMTDQEVTVDMISPAVNVAAN